MNERYEVLEDSQSGSHYLCYTVIDTIKPLTIAGIVCEGQYEIVCETVEKDIANTICNLLNSSNIE